jgi:hypothetical protein
MIAILERPVSAMSKGPRFSGHESFACRYAWLPKAHRALSKDVTLFSRDEDAMLELGIGKNMVKSLRFWVEAMGVAEPTDLGGRQRGLKPTPFGEQVLGKDGLDPYLEDIRTHWLLHWNVSSKHEAPLFAWDFLINHWPLPEFSRSEALAAFGRESKRLDGNHSEVTLAQHLDVFLHTYLAGRSASVGLEDSLDGPLVDLSLLIPVGERRNDTGRYEPVYSFRRETKPEISDALFDYCLMDFWSRFEGEDTLSLRTVSLAPGSPGQVFKLPEDDVRARLEEAGQRDYERPYSYSPSAVQGLLTRSKATPSVSLGTVYGQKASNA